MTKRGGGEDTATKILTLSNGILILSVSIALVFTTLLWRDRSKLKHENAALSSSILELSGTLAGPPSAEVGDIVPPFDALSMTGEITHVTYDGSSRYLLYFFSSQCDSCTQQLPTWNRLASAAETKNCKVVAVSIDSPEVVRANVDGEPSQIFTVQNRAVLRAYRVVAIPFSLMVSTRGTMEWVNYGDLTEPKIKELSSIWDRRH